MTDPLTLVSPAASSPSALDRALAYLSIFDSVLVDFGGFIPGAGPGVAAGAVAAGKLIAIAQAASAAHEKVTGQPIDLAQHAPLQPLT